MTTEPQYSDILGNIVYNQIIFPYRKHVLSHPDSRPQRINDKPKKKCLRNGCEILTNHNGGYCSADCCRMDK